MTSTDQTGTRVPARVDGSRRSLLAGGGAAAALWLSGVGTARAQAVPAFKQAVAEGAARDEALAAFYRAHDFKGIWTGTAERDRERRRALLTALAGTPDHGLPQGSYGLPRLEAMLQGARSQRDLGQIEVELSRLFLRYASDVQTGILEPRSIDAGFVMTVPLRDRLATLEGFARGAPGAVLRRLPPSSPEYVRLMREKIRLEHLIAAGGWGAPVPVKALQPGETGAAAVALRNRLIAMGYLRRTATASYDSDIVRAVQQFQIDNGITADGVAGEATMAELNRPAEDRLAAVLVAMERERWMNMPLGDRHIWVNLPDFTAQIRDHDRVTFETRAVVGANQADRRSPEFSDQMELIVANPSWHVPRSITVKEYLPMLRRNPYAAGHLKIIDRSGRVVDRGSVNFAAYTERNFPFAMRQPPSQNNALGLVKFLFPNRWNIYLHDTPAKNLFGREVRAFSHGCIRLNDPFDFAYALLSRQATDPQDLFRSHLDSGRESTIHIEHPVPVHLTYRTAFTTAKGRMGWRRDVYGRDAKVFAALQAAGVALDPLQG